MCSWLHKNKLTSPMWNDFMLDAKCGFRTLQMCLCMHKLGNRRSFSYNYLLKLQKYRLVEYKWICVFPPPFLWFDPYLSINMLQTTTSQAICRTVSYETWICIRHLLCHFIDINTIGLSSNSISFPGYFSE